MSKQTIPDTDEAWDERALGADTNFVEVVDEQTESIIDEASGTQLISIRMQKSMIEDFKLIASLNGEIGYQTLMKQILQRFIDSEKKIIFRELVAEKLKEQQQPATVTQVQTKRRSASKKAA